MKKLIRDLKVIDIKEIRKGFYTISVDPGTPLVSFRPGQFLQLKVEGSSETFLRRPISVHDFDHENNILKMLIQVVGSGTERLVRSKPGDVINAVFPLGNSFSMPLLGERVLLTGGGCGIAPLLFLGREIRRAGIEPHFLLGFRNASMVLDTDEYEKIGKVWLTTEDGSEGEKGYVTDHSVLETTNYDRIYCCGPDPMMKAVGKYAMGKGVECEVSLENLMACGFGVCLCCVVPTVNGNVCSCTEGPVFNVKDLKW
jgi:dihydroorotate dehydrogenase electron transfer subunit